MGRGTIVLIPMLITIFNDVTDILRNNNIMTIDQITELEITCFMYKYIKDMLQPCFDHFFKITWQATISPNVQEASPNSIPHFVD